MPYLMENQGALADAGMGRIESDGGDQQYIDQLLEMGLDVRDMSPQVVDEMIAQLRKNDQGRSTDPMMAGRLAGPAGY